MIVSSQPEGVELISKPRDLASAATNFGALLLTNINQNTGQIIDSGNLGDFGRINSTSNNPRLIQFALKLNF